MDIASKTTAPNGPLSQSQQLEVAAAHERAHAIRKAAAVAGFNGWVTGIAAACSAPFALFSLPGLLIAVGLTLVAYNEFKGRRRLLQYDQAAPTFLGWNQIGFLALICIYCIWMLVVGLTNESSFAAEIKASPELKSILGSAEDFDQFYRGIVAVFYGLVIALSVVFQGLNALYYFTRRKYVEAYVRDTPTWVLDLQQLTSQT